MPRYWVIAPFNSTMIELWEKVWDFDLEHGLISIGWRELGDVSNLTKEELQAALERTYRHTRSLNLFWSFLHEIQPGDIIIARRGRKIIAAVGTVVSHAFYDANKNLVATGTEHRMPNHISVRWHEAPRNKSFDRIVFGMLTCYEIAEAQYQNLVGETFAPTENKQAEAEVLDKTEFVLEKYLEEFIVSNFQAIFGIELVIFEDPEEKVAGQQYTTDVGIIDILAQEIKTGNFVVIELKKGLESDRVVGQTLRYMGWVQENLCTNGQTVSGIIICQGADARLNYAIKMTPNIKAKYYRINFTLNDE